MAAEADVRDLLTGLALGVGSSGLMMGAEGAVAFEEERVRRFGAAGWKVNCWIVVEKFDEVDAGSICGLLDILRYMNLSYAFRTIQDELSHRIL